MNTKPLIAIDIDGVITNGFMEGLIEKYGPPARPASYSLAERYPDLSSEEIEILWHSTTSYFDCHPEEGSWQAIFDLWSIFHVAIVTARPLGTRVLTLDWLKKYQFQFHTFQIATT